MFPSEITDLLPRTRGGGIRLDHRLEHVIKNLNVEVVYNWAPEGNAGARSRTSDQNLVLINENLEPVDQSITLATLLAGVALDGPGEHRQLLTLDEIRGINFKSSKTKRDYEAGLDLIMPIGPTRVNVIHEGAKQTALKLTVDPQLLLERMRKIR